MNVDALVKWMSEQLLVDLVGTVREFANRLKQTELGDLSCDELIRLSDAAATFADKVHEKFAFGFRQAALPLSGNTLEQRFASERLYQLVQQIEHARIILTESGCCANQRDAATSYLRCIDWSSRMIRDRYATYDEVPRDWFLDLHSTYARAMENLVDKVSPECALIRDQYVSLLLFAIINPYGLMREEMDEMHSCLLRVAAEVALSGTPPSKNSRFVDLTGRVMPHISLSPRVTSMTNGVFLDVEALMSGEAADALPKSCDEAMVRFVTRLAFHLIPRENRDAKTTSERELYILLVSGFRDVHRYIEMQAQARGSKKTKFVLANLSWEGEEPVSSVHSLARDSIEMSGRQGFRMEVELEENDIWRNGGKVIAREDLFGVGGSDLKGDGRKSMEPKQWQLINISQGGYRLRWRFKQDCHAAVDELVLIHELDENEELTNKFNLGVIRWVRKLVSDGLDVGIERLPGRFESSFVTPIDDDRMGLASIPVLAGFDESGKLNRLVACSGELLPGSTVKMSGHLAPVRLERISMVGDGFVVMNAGTMNE